MRIRIDETKCIGAGQCVLSAPDVFDQREEDAVSYVIAADPPQDRRGAIRAAAALCPTGAISIDEADA